MPVATASTRSLGNPAAAALDTLAQFVAAPFEPTDRAFFTSIANARGALAVALDSLGSALPHGPSLDRLLGLANTLAAHPACAFPATEPIHTPHTAGWLADLVRLFAAPAWQTPDARPLSAQPTWLWPAQARHLFAAPALLPDTASEHRWASHLVAQLDAAVRLLEANRGSSAARIVAQIALNLASTWPAFGALAHLPARQTALARLRALLAPSSPAFSLSLDRPALGALRVALLTETSAPLADTYAPSRLAALLDPTRVELTSLSIETLPADLARQVATLRDSAFDAVIFAGDLTRDNALSSLALHRLAPRHFATAHSPHTTGIPTIDVFLAGPDATPGSFTEKLAILPAALAADTPPALVDEQSALTRADLGLPADARLLVATVHPTQATAATRAAWQRHLDSDSSARLVLLPGAPAPALDLLLADAERHFAPRLISAGNTPLDPHVLFALLRVCDAYLAQPCHADAPLAQLARHLGLPVLAEAALDPAAARPACQPTNSATVDALAFADALTDLLEQACRTPLAHERPIVPAGPLAAGAAARHARGKQLLDAARPDRAALYLLAAVESPDATPDMWHDLALALHAGGNRVDAIDALTTCARLDPARLETWLLLADWARDCGHDELFREVAAIAQDLAPADARVVHLRSTLAA